MSEETRDDKAMFDAYVSLRKIAQKYRLENKLAIPRVVFVGETSAGKSMLVQNFLRFPCAFSQSDVGTRCPVLYRLRYNPDLRDGEIVIKHPTGIQRAADLAEHLRQVMERIEKQDGFCLDEYLVHIESNQYRDFEILDVPGLIRGAKESDHCKAVERITEYYVRDPTFLIVQLKESTQLGVNSAGTQRIKELCLNDPAPCGSTLPPRTNYEDYTITIQTKFDLFMDKYRDGTEANINLSKLDEHFNQQTLFVSMIFDGYNFARQTYGENAQYIGDLPVVEEQRVENWINEMKRKAESSSHRYEQFKEDRFRPLIGINVVRDRIQEMWVRAFRGAVPKIQQILRELVQEQKLRYETLVKIIEEKDLNITRDLYRKYIKRFRSTIAKYISFRAEINSLFDFTTYSRTYPQIEEEFEGWERKYPFEWLAHQNAEQMLRVSAERRLDSLTKSYIGARHFERIRQVFFYMILSYKPRTCTQDWIESAQGMLYGANADNENLEKGVREMLYTNICETFVMGLCWFTHIYAFLLEHFELHVTKVLLSPNGEFASLAVGHEKFLSYVRLEYHRITRQMLLRAVEGSRCNRYARMQYAASSVCHFLRVLVESFPPTISTTTTTKREQDTADLNPKRLIFSDKSFLAGERDSASASYIPEVRSTADDIYKAVRGLLLQDIITHFFSNVVGEVQKYDSIVIPNALEHRLGQMSNKEIAQLSQVDFDKNIGELEVVYEKLTTLEEACDEIAMAIRLFDGKVSDYSMTQSEYTKKTIHEQRAQQHHKILKKLYQVKTQNDDSELTDEETQHDYEDKDEYQLRILNNDPASCQQFLLELFRNHDVEDLKANFLEGDQFEKNKPKKILHESTNGSGPDTTTQQVITPATISSSATGKTQAPTQETTSTSAKNESDQSRIKWYDKTKK